MEGLAADSVAADSAEDSAEEGSAEDLAEGGLEEGLAAACSVGDSAASLVAVAIGSCTECTLHSSGIAGCSDQSLCERWRPEGCQS